MEEEKGHVKRKPGRPPKVFKRDQRIEVSCTVIERRVIEARARSSGLTVSEYLREFGLTGIINLRNKALPKEVLQLIGNLYHLAANMNQVAKKRNQFDELDAIERAVLQQQVAVIKQLVVDIKSYLK